MSVIAMRICSHCGEPKPETGEYFRFVVKRNGISYLRHICIECARQQGRRLWRNTVGNNRVLCPYTPDELAAIRASISPDASKPVSWSAVARHLGLKESLLRSTVSRGTRAGIIPPNRYIAANQRNGDALAIVNRYLNRHEIGTPDMGMQDRLKLAEKRIADALVPKELVTKALIASRYQNAQLRAENRELRRQVESLWQLRDGYRKVYEKPAPDYRTADDGWQIAEVGD